MNINCQKMGVSEINYAILRNGNFHKSHVIVVIFNISILNKASREKRKQRN